MELNFSKYHGAGNDFIMIDSTLVHHELSCQQISLLCNRRYGIGADGLMLLIASENYNFEMKYYNSDGYEGSMCGNGGRCIVAFAAKKKIVKETCVFKAIDGIHRGVIHHDASVTIDMRNTSLPVIYNDGCFIDTGSPHFVQFVNDINTIDASIAGKLLRYDARFAPAGTNVNFVQKGTDALVMRTYERGVEAETLACGTGAVAAALCNAYKNNTVAEKTMIKALGGNLIVSFKKSESGFYDIQLTGPAVEVFTGTFNLV